MTFTYAILKSLGLLSNLPEEKNIMKKLFETKEGRSLGSSAIVFGGQILSKGLAALYTILLARLLQEYLFGLYMLAIATIQFVIIPSNMGLSEILSKFISQYHAKDDQKSVSRVVSIAFFLILGLSIFFSLLAFMGSELISNKIFKNPDLSMPLKILIWGVPFTCGCHLFFSIFRGFMDAVAKVLFECILLPLLKILIFLLLFMAGIQMAGACWAFVVSSALVCGMLFLRISSKHAILITPRLFDKSMAQSLTNTAWPLSIYALVYVANTYIDRISLGILMTPVEVGIYAAGASLVSVIAFVPSSFSYLALPAFAQINDEDGIRRYQDEYKRISTYMFEFGLPLLIALILLAKETLNLLYGFGYIQAKIAMIILSVGMFSRCILGPAEDLILSVAITKPIMSFTFFGCLINILLNFVLIPVMGIEGAALATCSSMLFTKIYAFVVAYRRFRINPFNYKQLHWAAICLCIAIPVWYLKAFFAESLNLMVHVPMMYILFLLITSMAWYFMFRRSDKSIFRLGNDRDN